MLSDISIARKANMQPIIEVADGLEIPENMLHPFGHYTAKIDHNFICDIQKNNNGKLILVTAITPTPSGEGKTTTTVGIGDALSSIGKKTMICLREPSLGPCFGMKGGAAGGGYAQVVPMESINLHFTGDFHAISSAHNLLAAMIDNHIYWGNELEIDSRRVSLRRVVDLNDRSLREVVCGLGPVTNGYSRQTGFDITVASEVMAIFCLAQNLEDLNERLGNIIIGYRRDRSPVRAKDIKANGAMAVLLRDALMPNLVQTLENTPAFVHGGPFANIAHGCNSLIATNTALKLSDYVITEAGFGADLGAEKFFDIKCRQAGFNPDAVVIVATLKALKVHGGVLVKDADKPNLEALVKGMDNLDRHIENLAKFGVPVSVAINRFEKDIDDEIEVVNYHCKKLGIESFRCNHWEEGSKGCEDIAKHLVKIIDNNGLKFKFLYEDELPLLEKIRKVAQDIYHAKDISAPDDVYRTLERFEKQGFGNLPVCMAKTQYSFSSDPKMKGSPSNHILHVREVRLGAGARFVVIVCGEIMTMPGLPRVPSANNIYLNDDGIIEGLF